jgi:membrane protein YdbS with pleckstrin-like domain
MSASGYISDLESLKKREISNKVEKYRNFSIIVAVFVHLFAFITGIILLVVFSYPFITLIIFHGTMQILSYIHIYLGPKIYEKRLRRKVLKPDLIMLNRHV